MSSRVNVRWLALLSLALLTIAAVPLAHAVVPPGFVLKWGSRGSGPGQFGADGSVTNDASGNVYVCDKENSRIQKFSGSGTLLLEWGGSGAGDGRFNWPSGIAVNPSGDVYVVEGGNHRVQMFDSDGTFLLKWGIAGTQSSWPLDIAVDAAGFVYVSDIGDLVIRKFSPSGTLLLQWAAPVWRLALDDAGDLYGSTWPTPRIHKMTSTGVLVSSWDVGSQWEGPWDLDADPNGLLYLAYGSRIKEYDASGQLLVSWGTAGGEDGQFFGIAGVTVDDAGRLFVFEGGNHRVQRFDPGVAPPPVPPANNPSILLHVGPVVARNACAAGTLATCPEAVVSAGLSTPAGPYYFVYLLTSRGSYLDVAGLEMGIQYENGLDGDLQNGHAIDIFSWTLCATLEFPMPTPEWPAPGSGNLITWDPILSCQTDSIAVAGYFYLAAYSPDILRITPRPVSGHAKVGTCDAAELTLTRADLGYVVFSDDARAHGCNPCLRDCDAALPALPTSWSYIKGLYR